MELGGETSPSCSLDNISSLGPHTVLSKHLLNRWIHGKIRKTGSRGWKEEIKGFLKNRIMEKSLALRQVSLPPRRHWTGCPRSYSGNNGVECGVLDPAGLTFLGPPELPTLGQR